METRVPDVELFVVIKWMFVVAFGAGLAQLASLWVKRKWYGSEKHTRRNDEEDSRGWIERFLSVQKQSVDATVLLANKMQLILDSLNNNGKAIQEFTKAAECKYEGEKIHNGRR
jgi:hypothetical protein